jgi:hypothetical protein
MVAGQGDLPLIADFCQDFRVGQPQHWGFPLEARASAEYRSVQLKQQAVSGLDSRSAAIGPC